MAQAYTCHKSSHSVITAFYEEYVRRTFQKVSLQLDFLNLHTETGLAHARMKYDQELYKKASKLDEERNEFGWGSDIKGVTHDKPRKLRGDRVYSIFFEECFAPDTLVIMHDYSRKRIEDIKVGDFVMGIDGTPQEVIKTNSGYNDLCIVKQLKGENYITTLNHKLYLEKRPRVGKQLDKIELITPNDYLSLSNYNKRTTYGLKSSGLQFNYNINDLDPYFFGLWLGDGNQNAISIIINESVDSEIKNYVLNYYNNNLDSTHHITIKDDTKFKRGEVNCILRHYQFSSNTKGPNKNKLLNIYKKYNLINNKHIPKELYYSSIDYRLKVLAGIIDTDGSLKKGSRSYSFSYEISMSRKELINDISELARSCGFYTYCDHRIMNNGYKKGSNSYRVCIRGDLRRIPVLIARKKLPIDYKQTSNPLSTSIKIEKYGFGKYCGITLKSYNKETDNLFLLNDYTIVHNCGSDPVLETTYTQSEALVVVGGKRVGSRFVFGCVCKGTKVWTGDGRYINIEDLKVGDTVMGFDGEKASVEPVTYIQEPQKKHCYEITTTNGSLRCSYDHPLMALLPRKNKKYRSVTFERAENLKIGDRLVIKGNDSFGFVHEPDAYLLGVLLGDGNYSKNEAVSLSITSNQQYDYLNTTYNIGISKLSNSSNGIYSQIYFKGSNIKNKLEQYGMYGQVKLEKCVPNTIWNWDKESISEFLAGYFDADGNVQIVKQKHRAIKLTSICEHLLKDIQALLSKYGINSYILKEIKKNRSLTSVVNQKQYTVKDHDTYVLYICNSEDIITFRNNITLKIKEKKDRLDSYTKYYCKNRYKKVKFELNNKNNKGKYFVNKELSNIITTKIIKIEDIGDQDIYNLTANKTHTYLSNGFVSANTGGDEGPALEGLKKMFYNPKEYHILPYKNKYMKDGTIAYTGYFIPAFTMWFGCDDYRGNFTKGFDERGVVDEDRAREYYIKQFKKITDPSLLLKTRAEFCFSPEDAFVLEGSNAFNSEKLATQQMRIEKKESGADFLIQTARFTWENDKDGKVNRLSKPKPEYGVPSQIKILEAPRVDQTGYPFENLYVIGIDGIDTSSDTTTGQTDLSNFCVVVLRRMEGITPPQIVAYYKYRPKQVSDAYDVAIKLAQYYNAKVLVEATRVGVIEYFKKFGLSHYLMRKPSYITSGTNNKQFGVPASQAAIEHQLQLINDFVENYCEGIAYLEIIDELLRYSYENKRKFDSVAALGIALMADEELSSKQRHPKILEAQRESNLSRLGYYQNEYGQIVFGIVPKSTPEDYGILNNYGRHTFREENTRYY